MEKAVFHLVSHQNYYNQLVSFAFCLSSSNGLGVLTTGFPHPLH